jgi:hypothetical protein
MTQALKTTEDVAKAKDKAVTLEFIKRIKQMKVDPAISGYGDRISGLFENSEWVFICSEHLEGRFTEEQELKKHFSENSHTRWVSVLTTIAASDLDSY